MASVVDPRHNHLLAALPAGDWARIQPALEPVALRLGMVLYEPGVELDHVYFPTTAMLALLYVMESGASAEIAVVGNEGLRGISLFMGGDSTPSRAVVLSAGRRADANHRKTRALGPGMILRLAGRFNGWWPHRRSLAWLFGCHGIHLLRWGKT